MNTRWLIGLSASAYLVIVLGATALIKWIWPDLKTTDLGSSVAITVTGLVLIWYTAETSLLRRESHAQVAQSRRQADIAERMFEATHRPYIEILWTGTNFFDNRDFFRLSYRIISRGTIPAIIPRCIVHISHNNMVMDLTRDLGSFVLFPDRQEDFHNNGSQGGGISGTSNVKVSITVEYRGVYADRVYTTTLVADGNVDRWNEVTSFT